MAKIATLTPEIENALDALDAELQREYLALRSINYALDQMRHDHTELSDEACALATDLQHLAYYTQRLTNRLSRTQELIRAMAIEGSFVSQGIGKLI